MEERVYEIPQNMRYVPVGDAHGIVYGISQCRYP